MKISMPKPQPSLGIMIILLSLFIRCVYSSDDEETSAANGHSLWIVNNLPRYKGQDELTQDEVDQLQDDPMESDWLMGIIGFVAVSLLVPIISFIIWPFWCSCRVCQCCCCARSKPKNLKDVNRVKYYWAPFGFIILVTIVMVVFSGLAYQANGEFSEILLHRNHDNWQSVDAENTNLWDIMYGVMLDGSDKIDDINDQVNSLKGNISEAIDGVELILTDAGLISGGVDEINTMMNDLNVKWQDYAVDNTYTSPFFGTDTTTSFECDFCKLFGTTAASIIAQIDDVTGTIFDDLNEMTGNTQTELIDAESDILEAIDEFNDQIVEASDAMTDFQEDVDDQRSDVSDFNDQRELSYNVLFAIPLIPLFFIMVGGFTKISVCFTIGYILLWLSMVIMFILLAMHLPIAAMMNDVCGYMDTVDDNVTMYYNDTTGKVFASCLENTTLIEALGLDGELNFTESIEFPTFDNVAANFDFSNLDQFNSDAQATDESEFHEEGDDALTTINSMTSSCATGITCDTATVWTRANFQAVDINAPTQSELHPDNYYDTPAEQTNWNTLATAIDILYSENEVSGQFTARVNDYQTEIQAVVTKKDEIAANTQTVTDQANAAADLLDPVFVIVDGIIDSARCDFIGDGYLAFHEVLCQDMMGVIASIVVAMIVVAAMSFVGCIASVKMVRRSYWMNKQTKEKQTHPSADDHKLSKMELSTGLEDEQNEWSQYESNAQV